VFNTKSLIIIFFKFLGKFMKKWEIWEKLRNSQKFWEIWEIWEILRNLRNFEKFEKFEKFWEKWEILRKMRNFEKNEKYFSRNFSMCTQKKSGEPLAWNTSYVYSIHKKFGNVGVFQRFKHGVLRANVSPVWTR
jgi:hypothetical protein